MVLHSAMQSSDQKKVFSNYPRYRKVVSSRGGIFPEDRL